MSNQKQSSDTGCIVFVLLVILWISVCSAFNKDRARLDRIEQHLNLPAIVDSEESKES